MASQKKLIKTAKKSHPGRDGKWLKQKGKGIKGVSFYTSSDRAAHRAVTRNENTSSFYNY